MNKQRSIENEKLGITKGYIERWDYNNNKGETIQHYYAKCGYSSNEYGYIYNHVNSCLVCKRLLGISKSQIINRREIVLYFLLDKEIVKYARSGYSNGLNTFNNYHIAKDEDSVFSNDFKILKSYNARIALKKDNIIYRNYEYTEMVRNMMGNSDNSFKSHDYINLAENLGLFDLKICDLPLNTIARIVDDDHNALIEDIEIVEPKQDRYIHSVGYDGITIKKNEHVNTYLEDQFFRVKIRNTVTNKIETRSFIWQWDETAKCLIEVSNDCKNYQEAILFLYPKEIKNRAGTLRQGEFFFEPSNIKAKSFKHQFENEKLILDKIHEKSNHFATHRIVIFGDPYQYVSGTIRHNNKDHRMLSLKKDVWYRVHESNKINAWSIDLRNNRGSFD